MSEVPLYHTDSLEDLRWARLGDVMNSFLHTFSVRSVCVF